MYWDPYEHRGEYGPLADAVEDAEAEEHERQDHRCRDHRNVEQDLNVPEYHARLHADELYQVVPGEHAKVRRHLVSAS